MAGKADTSMTIRMNREVKEEAQMIFSELGMDMTTAINVFLRQAIYHSGFPFEVVLHAPNDVTLSAMKSAEQGKDMHGPFDSVSSLMDALNNA
nr:type II toxin-antitoxin system RelB/DinJ family antitoxin [uncultured Sphaerochaeta sp.]